MSNPLSTSSFKECLGRMSELGKARIPFFFALDYDQSEGLCLPLDELSAESGLHFQIGDFAFPQQMAPSTEEVAEILACEPLSLEAYQTKFNTVYQGLQAGDSFLLNLSLRTPISLSTDLATLYDQVSAPYKLLLSQRFLSFSPETFVKISDKTIRTYPMKGTIDASLPNAREQLLNDYKENCEHYTIVDLMRNDLNRVAEGIRVERFKFLSEIETLGGGKIWQMSSEVVGDLADNWRSRLGEIFETLLPAGSISGAPKQKTCDIILEAEGEPRGFYTGVWGVFDGSSLDSAVLIRFIEEDEGGKHFYRSGGGITINSKSEEEYAECLQKIYLPIK